MSKAVLQLEILKQQPPAPTLGGTTALRVGRPQWVGSRLCARTESPTITSERLV